MCKALRDLLDRLDTVDIENMDDADEYVNKDNAVELIEEAFKKGGKFYYTLDTQNEPPQNKFLLVKFEGDHEIGEFGFCRLYNGTWRDEQDNEQFPCYWSYIEKP